MQGSKISHGSKFIVFSIVLGLLFSVTSAFARESYESYRGYRDKNVKKDRPFSEITTGGLMDELRDAVRDEIDSALSKERKASKHKVKDKSKLIRDVRKIVRKEIEDAINIKEKNYLSKGTMEAGGFFSLQATAIEGSDQDNNFIIKFYPLFNYFLLPNLAIQVRAGIEVNITDDTQEYYGLVGPQFAFGMDKRDRFVFFSTFLVGISYDTSLSNGMGYRFGNELGVKFIFERGVSINIGLMIAFDNAGDQVQGFQDLFIPTVGITAWF